MRIVVATWLMVAALSATVRATDFDNLTRVYDHPIVYGGNKWTPPTLPAHAASSVFPYTYNTAFIESGPYFPAKEGCLLARVQNYSSPSTTSPGPSRMVLTCFNETTQAYDDVTPASVVFEPSTKEEAFGTEDPRVRLVNDTYYLFYTAVQWDAATGGVFARLSLATTQTPNVKDSWRRHGALFPDANGFQFTKSGALLVQGGGLPSYLIFGDCTLYQGLQVAVASADLLSYSVLEDFLLIEKRPQMFDAGLVEAGPPPMRLADGNWFFLYNGAQHLQGVPNQLFYSPGWVVLNGTNPLQVLDRAGTPLIMPTYAWETYGLTPYVIFVEGMKYVDASSNTFMAFYGAADTNIGAFTFTVEADPHRPGKYRVR